MTNGRIATIATVLFFAFLLTGAGVPRALAQSCPGDCDGDGKVTIDELITAVNMALASAGTEVCSALDTDGDNAVSIDELVAAVDASVNGCPCVASAGCTEILPGPEAQDQILEALLTAEPGNVVLIRAGRYELTGELSLQVNGVTIRGEGMDRTILSFAGQTTGAQSLLVRADDFKLENIAFENGPTDLVKILGSNRVTIRGVRTEWTGGPDPDNGAYGLYPVQCTDVLIEDSVVKGASDAGVYVGQSRNIIVRRNTVEDNVAGIEIENSSDADVFDNVARNNTGGILVFNLPGLPVRDGRRTRVHDNLVETNNTHNFGRPGSTVSATPDGTGMIVLANDQVEVFDNTFRENGTAHIIIIGYQIAELLGGFTSDDPLHDRYSETIFIHDNTYEGGGDAPDPDLAPILEALNDGLPLPNIIYDGDVNPDKLVKGEVPPDLRLCVQEQQVSILNLDLQHDYANPSKDLTPYDCTHPELSAIVIAEPHLVEISPGTDAQDRILTALLEAEPGDVILLKAGRYDLTEQLSLQVDGVTLRGEGMNDTVLSFAGQTTGGEGLFVQADRFVLEDIGLEDAPGDLFKIVGSNGVTVRRVRTEWTNGPSPDNGAYGVYPVQCHDVLVEDSVAKGASDTGIYVGQSNNIIIRRNHVESNVAGIEIENSTGADVHDNMATGNTGGILVFNLPGLEVQHGQRTRIYNNDVIANNTHNFAPEGNIVGGVPDGTGVMILANDKVEVFDNTFQDNNTSQITIISYNTAVLLSGVGEPNDPNFDAYSESSYILENTYIGGGTMPDSDLDVLVPLVGLPIPNIVIDGDIDTEKFVDDALPAELVNCIEGDPTFVNLNIPGAFDISRDLTPYRCTQPRLPPVAIPGVE